MRSRLNRSVFPQIDTGMMMNGLSSAPLNSGDVKYPPNVGRGLSAAELDVDKLYEPKQNKKIVRSPDNSSDL